MDPVERFFMEIKTQVLKDDEASFACYNPEQEKLYRKHPDKYLKVVAVSDLHSLYHFTAVADNKIDGSLKHINALVGRTAVIKAVSRFSGIVGDQIDHTVATLQQVLANLPPADTTVQLQEIAAPPMFEAQCAAPLPVAQHIRRSRRVGNRLRPTQQSVRTGRCGHGVKVSALETVRH